MSCTKAKKKKKKLLESWAVAFCPKCQKRVLSVFWPCRVDSMKPNKLGESVPIVFVVREC